VEKEKQDALEVGQEEAEATQAQNEAKSG